MKPLLALSIAAAAFVACGGHSSSSTAANPDDSGAPTDDAGDTSDAGSVDASPPPSKDASPPVDSSIPPDPNDGTPTRQACTSAFGTGLSMSHARLDGYLVAIVALGTHQCNGDSSHVHLQIKMNNAIYDVAVNADTMIAERDIAIPDGAWAEGWHTSMSLDYPSLGLHSKDFASVGGTAQLAQKIEQELANANHLSVFCTGYGPDGCHLVHRQYGGRDGAIVIHPTSATSHILFFDFSNTAPF